MNSFKASLVVSLVTALVCGGAPRAVLSSDFKNKASLVEECANAGANPVEKRLVAAYVGVTGMSPDCKVYDEIVSLAKEVSNRATYDKIPVSDWVLKILDGEGGYIAAALNAGDFAQYFYGNLTGDTLSKDKIDYYLEMSKPYAANAQLRLSHIADSILYDLTSNLRSLPTKTFHDRVSASICFARNVYYRGQAPSADPSSSRQLALTSARSRVVSSIVPNDADSFTEAVLEYVLPNYRSQSCDANLGNERVFVCKRLLKEYETHKCFSALDQANVIKEENAGSDRLHGAAYGTVSKRNKNRVIWFSDSIQLAPNEYAVINLFSAYCTSSRYGCSSVFYRHSLNFKTSKGAKIDLKGYMGGYNVQRPKAKAELYVNGQQIDRYWLYAGKYAYSGTLFHGEAIIQRFKKVVNRNVQTIEKGCSSGLPFVNNPNCKLQAKRCVDDTPCKTIQGERVCLSDLGRTCWQYENVYVCVKDRSDLSTGNSCRAFEQEPSCVLKQSSCTLLDPIKKTDCLEVSEEWQCG